MVEAADLVSVETDGVSIAIEEAASVGDVVLVAAGVVFLRFEGRAGETDGFDAAPSTSDDVLLVEGTSLSINRANARVRFLNVDIQDFIDS